MQSQALRRSPWLLVPLLVIGCGSAKPAHEHPEPLSVDQHEEHAQAHDSQAESKTEQVNPYSDGGDQVQCVDVGGPITSGGERVKVMRPCWTQAEQNSSALRAADAHRKAAAEHRDWAQQLVEVEHEACQALGEIERSTSPFVRGPDILSVEQYKQDGNLLGATITFRKVVGLSKAWLIKSMKCHQARAAKLGFASDFMTHCPLTLKHTATSVTENADTVVVTLRSKDPLVAAQIYGRALRAASDDPE